MVAAIHHRGSGETKVKHETSAAYDSQSNGGTEVGVRNVRGLFRTLKACLEGRVKRYVPPGHALIPWLLQHCCTLFNVRVNGEDGTTSRARIRRTNFNQLLLGFGEPILWNMPSHGPLSPKDGDMGVKWGDGTFLGYHRSSNTYFVGT